MKGKIFNAQEVQAIILGNKRQFREVIKPQPLPFLNDNDYLEFLCPYQVKQKIFVKEKFWIVADNKILNKSNIFYQADGKIFGIWTPAQHMKQEHSRLTLQIKEIRVERLAGISEEDAIVEGVFKSKDYWHSTLHPIKGTYQCWTSAKEAFEKLWNTTHKKPEDKFGANPWVWVIDFEVVK
jgi:hypothetical protein